MKNDPSFKLVAAIIVAGVLTALISPSRAVITPDSAPVAETAQASNHAE